MVWSKGCARCGGDLMRMDDDYEPYLSCLQCGNTLYQTDDRRTLVATPVTADSEDAERS